MDKIHTSTNVVHQFLKETELLSKAKRVRTNVTPPFRTIFIQVGYKRIHNILQYKCHVKFPTTVYTKTRINASKFGYFNYFCKLCTFLCQRNYVNHVNDSVPKIYKF